jgi:hypothetical protein
VGQSSYLQREKRIEADIRAQLDTQICLVARMQRLALWHGWWDDAEALKRVRLGLRMLRDCYRHDPALCIEVLNISNHEMERRLADFEQRLGVRHD